MTQFSMLDWREMPTQDASFPYMRLACALVHETVWEKVVLRSAIMTGTSGAAPAMYSNPSGGFAG